MSLSCRPREGCGLRLSILLLITTDGPSCRPREGCGLRRTGSFTSGPEVTPVAVPVRGAGCVSKTAQPKGIELDAFYIP